MRVFVGHLSPDGDLELGPAFVVHRFVQNHTSTVGEVDPKEVCIGLRESHDQFILLGGAARRAVQGVVGCVVLTDERSIE